MKNRSDGVCQWKHCDASASKHVWFGLRVHDTVRQTPLSALLYTTDDLDLCDKHAGEVGRQYVHVTEFGLE